MSLYLAMIYGIVEGITEFLPVSSTGHLMLTSAILGESGEFIKSFEIIIQLGAICSVIFLYWKKIIQDWDLNKKVVVAFIPTGIIGLSVYKYIKMYLLGNTSIVVWALLIGGIILIIFELLHRQEFEDQSDFSQISYPRAVVLGLFQSIAMIPGVSRSAATIIGGLSLGINRKTIVEFSFILAVPTMLAATGLDLYKNASSFSGNQYSFLAVGFVISFIVAAISIKFLLKYIQRHNFIWFGVYRILAAIAFWFFVVR